MDYEPEEIEQLLKEVKQIDYDLQKFDGNPAPALAERLIKVINKVTPYADLFDDESKVQIKEYIEEYESLRTSSKEETDLGARIKPTYEMIINTLEDRVEELRNG